MSENSAVDDVFFHWMTHNSDMRDRYAYEPEFKQMIDMYRSYSEIMEDALDSMGLPESIRLDGLRVGLDRLAVRIREGDQVSEYQKRYNEMHETINRHYREFNK